MGNGPSGMRVPDFMEKRIMAAVWIQVRRFLRAEDGPTAVEYAVMLALFIVVCLTAISAFQPRQNPVSISAPAAPVARQ